MLLMAEVPALSDVHDQLVLAVVGLATLLVTALVYVIKTYGTTKEVNKAVNDVGPGEHRLYDKVAHNTDALVRMEARLEQHSLYWADFHARWSRLPPELDDSTDLVTMLHDIRAAIARHGAALEALGHRVGGVASTLDEHVEWELGEKYKDQHDAGH